MVDNIKGDNEQYLQHCYLATTPEYLQQSITDNVHVAAKGNSRYNYYITGNNVAIIACIFGAKT